MSTPLISLIQPRETVTAGNDRDLGASLQRPFQIATTYLLGGRASDRSWSDFETLAGESTVWVSAYIADALIEIPGMLPLLGDTQRWLIKQQRWSGGWGYHPKVPADADSTAFVLLSLRCGNKITNWRLWRARRFLRKHLRIAEQGYATFALSGAVRRSMALAKRFSLQGWCQAHFEVTATVLSALAAHGEPRSSSLIAPVLQGFLSQTESVGAIPRYWWRTPLYPAAMALRACQALGVELSEQAHQRWIRWVVRQQRPDGSWGPRWGCSFTTALALDVLYYALQFDKASNDIPDRSVESRIKAGIRWLLSQQARAGYWRGDHILQLPPPQVLCPQDISEWTEGGRGGGSWIADHNHFFTTATVVRALNRWSSLA